MMRDRDGNYQRCMMISDHASKAKQNGLSCSWRVHASCPPKLEAHHPIRTKCEPQLGGGCWGCPMDGAWALLGGHGTEAAQLWFICMRKHLILNLREASTRVLREGSHRHFEIKTQL